MFGIGYGLSENFEALFAKYSGFPCQYVTFLNEEADGFPSFLDRDRGGPDNAFDDRIGIGVNREFGRTIARFAHGNGLVPIENGSALALGFERKERSHEKVRGFVGQYRASGGSVVSGRTGRRDDEKPVAPEPDGGMPADFHVK